MFKILILRGLNQNIRTCSKLKEEPKEPPDPSGLEDKDSSLHLCYTWGRYQITFSKSKQVKDMKKAFTCGGIYSWCQRVKQEKNLLMKSHDY